MNNINFTSFQELNTSLDLWRANQSQNEEEKKVVFSSSEFNQTIAGPLKTFPDFKDDTQLKMRVNKLFPEEKKLGQQRREILSQKQQVLAINDIKTSFEKNIERDAATRLQEAMQLPPIPSDDVAKAEKLQTILNLLLQERTLVSQFWIPSQVHAEASKAEKRYQHEDSDTTLDDRYIFDCPEVVENSTEWAARLRILGMMKEINSLIVTIAEASKKKQSELARWVKLYDQIQKFKDAFPSNKFMKRLDNLVQFKMLLARQSHDFDVLDDLIRAHDHKSLLLKERKSYVKVEDAVAPYVSYLLASYQGLIQSCLPQGVNRYNEVNAFYSKIRQICGSYASIKRQQDLLYQEAYKSLRSLITSKKPQIEWRKYDADLRFEDRRGSLPENLPDLQLTMDPLQEILETYGHKAIVGEPETDEIVKTVALPPRNLKKKNKGHSKTRRPHAKKLIFSVPPAPKTENPEKKGAVAADVAVSRSFPYAYAKRVLRWLNCSLEGSLDRTLFWDYDQKPPAVETWLKIVHGFTSSADLFYNIGIKSTWVNAIDSHQDTLYVVPADLIIQEQTHRGYLTYCIGKDGICYHRCFADQLNGQKILNRQLLEKLSQNSFYESDFPELNIKNFKKEDFQYLPFERAKDHPIKIDPLLGTVTLFDPRLNLTLKLYRVSVDETEVHG